MKDFMTHEEVNQLLKVGYDMPRGWSKEKLWHTKAIRMWKAMWRRCYDPKDCGYLRYIDSIIHDDFRLFSNYLVWLKLQPRFEEFCSTCHEVIWNIDKDIKCPGNRNYYPEFMILLTKSDNSKEAILRNPSCHKKDFHSKNRVPIIGINIKDNTIIILKSSYESKDLGFNPSNITNVLKGRWSTHKGYKWYYLDMNDRRSF